MSIVPYNIPLFQDLDAGSLKEFERLLTEIPCGDLIYALDKQRKNGRNDYPNETMFRCYVAEKFFEHEKTSHFIAELERNPSLRAACHIETKTNKDGTKQLAPDAAVFSRFKKRLLEHQELVDKIFDHLLEDIRDVLPDFGEVLALDGKIVESYANRPSKKTKRDGRRDLDADFTKKTYTINTPKGETITKTYSFFGYRIHLIVDAKYELPILFSVTPASKGERTIAKDMIEDMPDWLKERAVYLLADRSYDGWSLQKMIENKGIIPIIDIRNCWQGEETRQYKDTDFVYTYNGKVFYITDKGKAIRAHYKGYHKASDALHYETHPKDGVEKREVYIKRETDPRIFNQIARDSLKFKTPLQPAYFS